MLLVLADTKESFILLAQQWYCSYVRNCLWLLIYWNMLMARCSGFGRPKWADFLSLGFGRPALATQWKLTSTNKPENYPGVVVCTCNPATWEAKAGESLEPGRRRWQWARIATLRSSLGNRVRLHLNINNNSEAFWPELFNDTNYLICHSD